MNTSRIALDNEFNAKAFPVMLDYIYSPKNELEITQEESWGILDGRQHVSQ